MRVHEPVLVDEVLRFLNISPGKKYIDATVGAGGHSLEIVKRGGKVLGLDVDLEILTEAHKVLGKEVKLKKANYTNIKEIALEYGFEKVDGILFDLGVSSWQLERPERGFSFQVFGPLDMRMDTDLAVKATDLVNGLNVGELTKLFTKYGEESYAARIAREIVKRRTQKPLEFTTDLIEIVGKVKHQQNKRINPATLVFQALRIAVNDELNNLKTALPKAVEILAKNGRLVVISFHSLEDRIVKNFFKDSPDLKILTEKLVTPNEDEIKQNPRSRSAKLRAAEKIGY